MKTVHSEDYHGPDRRNGTTPKLIFWMMATAVSVVIAGGMAWMNTIYADVTNIKAGMAERGERLSTVEANYEAILTRLVSMEKAQLRLEEKFDRWLNQRKP